MSITIMKSLNKAIVDQLKQLEIESCKNGEISLKLELDYKLGSRQQETDNNEFLYYEGNQIIGYLGVLSFGSTAEITGMVHPEFRNQGYGKGLLENSIFELRKQGAKKIFLQVVTENENALGLYLNTGFIIDSCMEYYQI